VLHQLRLDVVQLALVLAAVASVLRSGTNLLDRFMLAAGLLAGGVLAFGLLFSVWPWRLAPVPVGGALFSLVVIAGWLTGRRPSLPRRWLGSDVVVLGSGLFAFLAAYAPIAGTPLAKRFSFSAVTTDRFNHFALFDTIHRLGGYAFLHQSQAQVSVRYPTAVAYPSGSHFLYAVFDIFLRSTTDPGAAVAEFSRYFVYVLAGYAFLVMALVWAARWIAGPLMAGWRQVLICSAVAGLALGGPLVQMVELGLDSEILGLAFLALAVAVTVRPPRVVHEQVLIVSALLIAVAYCYNLDAAVAGLGIVAVAVVYRRRLLRHWRFTVAVSALGVVIAAFPSALSLTSGFNAQVQVLSPRGWMVAVPGWLLAGLALIIVATMTSASSRRLPVWRAMTVYLGAAVFVLGAFAVFQAAEAGRTGYYFGKLLMAGYVVGLAGLGALGTFSRGLPAPSRPRRRLNRLREAPLAILSGAIALILTAGFQTGIRPTIGNPVAWPESPLSSWSAGQVQRFAGPSLAVLADAHVLGDGVPTLVLSGIKGTGWFDSYMAAVLNHDLGAMTGPLNAVKGARFYGAPTSSAALTEGISEVQAAIRASRFPLHLIVAYPQFAAKLDAMLTAHPSVKATVAVLPGLKG
jgi:hypothetical protein